MLMIIFYAIMQAISKTRTHGLDHTATNHWRTPYKQNSVFGYHGR